MLEPEKEIQNLEFGNSALIVEMKHFWIETDQPKNLTRWAVLGFPAETWRQSENKGAGGREDTIFQKMSSPKLFQRLQKAKTWDMFFSG